MKIKNTVRYHLTPSGMATIKKKKKKVLTKAENNKYGWGRRSCTVGGILKWFSHYGKQYGSY